MSSPRTTSLASRRWAPLVGLGVAVGAAVLVARPWAERGAAVPPRDRTVSEAASLSPDALVQAIRTHCDDDEWTMVLRGEARRRGDELGPPLAAALDACDGPCCAEILELLGRFPTLAAGRPAAVRRKLVDADGAVRSAAVRLIVAARIFDPETVDILWQGLERSEVAEGGTGSALWASGPQARARLAAIVESASEPSRRRVRAAAALTHGTREEGSAADRAALRTWLRRIADSSSDPDVSQLLGTFANEFMLPAE